MNSLLAYGDLLNKEKICEKLNDLQEKELQQFPECCLQASRKKIIFEFWYARVLAHFSFILLIGLFVSLPGIKSWDAFLFSLCFGGICSFVTLFGFHYWPDYYSIFLPGLERAIADKEKQIQVLAETKKCRRTQYPIPALTIIYFVFSRISGSKIVPCNDQGAYLLNNLFGADKDKLKQNLSRLHRISGLSPKEKAEFQKALDTARLFFQEINSVGAHSEIDLLERKLHMQ